MAHACQRCRGVDAIESASVCRGRRPEDAYAPGALKGKRPKQTWCADIQGFSLHAPVRCGRIAKRWNRAVVLKLKTAWRDGTTRLVISLLEFMQLQPNAKLRAQVVPREPRARPASRSVSVQG